MILNGKAKANFLKTTYNAREVADIYNLSTATVTLRAKKLNIFPVNTRSGKIFRFTSDQVYAIVNFYKQKIAFPDVVKMTETFWIAPSIGNFLTIEQLEYYEKNN